MKRNVMFAVYYVGCAPTVFIPPAAGCLPLAMQPVDVMGLLLHYYFVITGILTASWLPSAYRMSRI